MGLFTSNKKKRAEREAAARGAASQGGYSGYVTDDPAPLPKRVHVVAEGATDNPLEVSKETLPLCNEHGLITAAKASKKTLLKIVLDYISNKPELNKTDFTAIFTVLFKNDDIFCRRKFSDEMGLSYEAVTRWSNGDSCPHPVLFEIIINWINLEGKKYLASEVNMMDVTK